MPLRFVLLMLMVFLVWRGWKRLQALQGNAGHKPLPNGFAEDSDPLVRCERCGVRVPASQVAAIRSNCKLCDGGAP